VLAAAGGDVDAVRGEHVTALLAEGDPAAHEVFAEYAGWIALGLANLVALLDPEVVVLGGGVSAAGEDLVERVSEQLAERFPATFSGRDLRLYRTPGGPEAGALGAALLAAGMRAGGGSADR
jgi:glucokinase